MKLIAGSYEKFIWGFSFDSQQTLNPLFSYPSHQAPIKCLATAGTFAASGGADDAIKLYDLSSASEIGHLLEHTAAVTSLSFFSSPAAPSIPRNLISASDDGTVCIYDADPCVHLRTISAHRKGVNDLAVHPSGRAALTVGKDSCMALINLVRGRRSFSCRLEREASLVKYAAGGGEKFFMVTEERISVHESEDAKLNSELNAAKRILCAVPAQVQNHFFFS